MLRVDREHFHGWVVSVKRRTRIYNPDHSRDRAYGGPEGALRAAIGRRDELEARIVGAGTGPGTREPTQL